MKYLLYILELIPAVLIDIIAILFCWLIALFVDKDGHLPKYLKWFETTDATCFDVMWVAEHPTWSKYLIALTWIARNPAYGFNEFCNPHLPKDTKVTYKGNLDIADGINGHEGWYLIETEGYFHFQFIKYIGFGRCIRGDYGWWLLPLAKGYDSVVTGMLQVTFPVRFYDFRKK